MDLFTVLAMWSLAALTIAGILVALWLRDRSMPAYVWLGAGFLAAAVGVGLIAARGAIPDWLSIGVGNLLTVAAMTLWILGVYRFNGWALHPRALLPIAVYLPVLFFPTVHDTLWLRQVFILGSGVPGHLMLAHAFWPRGPEASRSRRPMAIIFLVVAAWTALATAGVAWYRPLSLDAYPIAWANGFISLVVLLVMMVFGAKMIRERDEGRLQHLATIDPLTGILNRRGLFAGLPALLAGAGAGKDRLALLMFDLDHFKEVNDRHGHLAGDRVLAAFCGVAEGQLGPQDLFGRLGGEEFLAVAAVDDLDAAQALADRIRAALARTPVEADGAAIPVTVSVGVALLPPAATDVTQALAEADRALYAAKAAGRDRVALAARPRPVLARTA
ncbi:GGDEF domain-containing protein [Marinibaculum pumilum]|uniref:diguanylate cyclase n=1 Tax=Marinibaculum pumilum TaxID=1766165 RepID=A0ABV7L1R6_9PROT